MKQAQVDAGLRDRLREFTQDTTRLSSPGDGETFIPGAVQGWNLDDYMARFAKQLDMPMLANGKRKQPCSMDALYVYKTSRKLCFVEFKHDRVLASRTSDLFLHPTVHVP